MSTPAYLLLSPTLPATGNASTITRISSFFPGSTVLDSRMTSPGGVLAVVDAQRPRALVFLHALHSGRLLAAMSSTERARLPPGILVLGGTDVSSDSLSDEDCLSFAASVSLSRLVVAFSADLGERFLRVAAFSGVRTPPLRVIAQSVLPCAMPGPLIGVCDPRAVLGLAPDIPLVIFAGSLRAVKDPTFVLKAWADWVARARGVLEGMAQQKCPAALLVVGPTLDDELGAAVAASSSPTSGIYCHAPVSRDVLLSWFSHADVVLNTSRTEGQSNTLLEAMSLGTPVIARNVDGNSSIIMSGVNGLLFDTADGAVALVAAVCGLSFFGDVSSLQSADTVAAEVLAAETLLADSPLICATLNRRYLSPLGARIAQSASLSVGAHHTVEIEERAWKAVLAELHDADAVPIASASNDVAPSALSVCAYVPRPFLSLSAAQRTASRDTVDVLMWLGSRAPFSSVVDTAEVLCGAGVQTPTPPHFWASSADGRDDYHRWPNSPRVFNLSSSSPSEAEQGPGWGRYGENRGIYSSSAHFSGATARTLHLGVDLGVASLTSVSSPISGRVHSVGLDTAPLGYGPTVVLAHAVAFTRSNGASARVVFYTLYGHLSIATVFNDGSPRKGLARGTRIAAGEPFAAVGSRFENGGWFPHVHFQVVTEIGFGGWMGDWPGVARAADEAAYRALAPDANILLRCPWVKPVGWSPYGCHSINTAEVVDVRDDELGL